MSDKPVIGKVVFGGKIEPELHGEEVMETTHSWADRYAIVKNENDRLREKVKQLEAGYRNQRDAKEALVERIAKLEAEVVNSFKTLIDMYANYDRQGVIETLEALYLEQKDE